MSHLKPLSPDDVPDLQDTFQHFKELLGYVPHNALVLARKPKRTGGRTGRFRKEAPPKALYLE